jgi:hypothetical protein
MSSQNGFELIIVYIVIGKIDSIQKAVCFVQINLELSDRCPIETKFVVNNAKIVFIYFNVFRIELIQSVEIVRTTCNQLIERVILYYNVFAVKFEIRL